MSNVRRKKQIAIRLEDMWAQVWIPGLLLFIISFRFWGLIGLDHELVLELTSEKPGVVQLFVNDGSGYSEANSIRYDIPKGGVATTLVFDLKPYSHVTQLRLDPINHDGSVIIDRMTYKRAGEWLSRSLLEPEYPNANGIRWQWNAKKSELGVYPTSGNQDPYFLIDADFQALGHATLIGKRAGLHVGALGMGLLLGFLFRRWSLRLWVRVWIPSGLPFQWLKLGSQKYQVWVDRFSVRYGMVNPTSCVVAGMIVAVYAWFLFGESELLEKRHERMSPELQFEIQSGETHRIFAYVALVGESKYREFSTVDGQQLRAGERVRVPLTGFKTVIRGIRIDPMESAGCISIADLRITYADGYTISLPCDAWNAKGNATILHQDAHVIEIRSSGEDPYVVSPDLSIQHELPPTLPASIAVPMVVLFFVTIALLLYNRLQTEGLSVEQIRNLQRM